MKVMKALKLMLGTSVLCIVCSCAFHKTQPEKSNQECQDAWRMPATEQLSFELNLKNFLTSWRNQTVCGTASVPAKSTGVDRQIFSVASDLSSQEAREGREAIAKLLMAEASSGTFLDTNGPTLFLTQLRELISSERKRSRGKRLPDDQIENHLLLSALRIDTGILSDRSLPQELRGPLNTLSESTKTELEVSLKDAGREELVAIAEKVEELYVREGERRWKELIEEAIDRCR